MKNRRILYIAYRIFAFPFYLITRIVFRKDLGMILRKLNNKLNNGRTYFITVFYYILYVSSLGFTIYTSITNMKAVFPKLDDDKKTVHWVLM